jgi:predicted  nucleic acid-binding Zn-ribbon protein
MEIQGMSVSEFLDRYTMRTVKLDDYTIEQIMTCIKETEDYGDIKEELATAQTDIDELEDANRELNDEINALNDDAEALKEEIENLKRELNTPVRRRRN